MTITAYSMSKLLPSKLEIKFFVSISVILVVYFWMTYPPDFVNALGFPQHNVTQIYSLNVPPKRKEPKKTEINSMAIGSLLTHKVTTTATEMLPLEIQNHKCLLSSSKPFFHICVYHPKFDSFISKALLDNGEWEPQIRNKLGELLEAHPQSGFLDLGSFIGPHSLFASAMMRPVVAVDPILENIILLNKSVKMNKFKNFITVNHCLSNIKEVINMTRPIGNPGGSMLEDFYHRKSQNQVSSRLASCITLNDLVEKIPFSDMVVKIDAEASECKIMLAGDDFFEKFKIPAILMEWGNQRLADYNCVSFMIKKLTAYDFRPYAYNGTRLSIFGFLKWPADIIWQKTGI